MDTLKDLWARDKALVIVFVIAVVLILWYVYRQNNSSTTSTTDANTPTTETEQLATILAALGQLTPVTNSTTVSSVVTAPPVTTTITGTPVTTTVTNSGSVAQIVSAGIGIDTARDAAIRAAEAKYNKSSQSAQLHAAIAAILKQYPRSGTTQ